MIGHARLSSVLVKNIFSAMVRFGCHWPALNSLMANSTAQYFCAVGAAVSPLCGVDGIGWSCSAARFAP